MFLLAAMVFVWLSAVFHYKQGLLLVIYFVVPRCICCVLLCAVMCIFLYSVLARSNLLDLRSPQHVTQGELWMLRVNLGMIAQQQSQKC